ncbi:uncharacterized protein EDB91DRAFT_1157930 [Suillus paluster]|uniref:uncharacterized protein n=1 Tax=Suillus paluster TaxID=48578 RepID=UPI001B85C4A9|nr:uncharacterized protein EDB91DRAFT_1157930 [Suillus paluster]KAG1730117.1 hypothetical protein EDB91DRAFT_1157930 [Suillus paluster]
MLTSRSIMFALFSFLVGVHACVQCPSTVPLNYKSMVALLTNTVPDNVLTLCLYDLKSQGKTGDPVLCHYYTSTGNLLNGYPNCPATANVKSHC